jgi:hypothetical protein
MTEGQAPPASPEGGVTDSSRLEGGSYEVIRQRLASQGRALADLTGDLNTRRQGVFGGTQLAVVGNERVRTENNCVPVDIATVGDHLLFGYNVFVGLKKSVSVGDVFSVVRVDGRDSGELHLAMVEDGDATAFLRDPTFVKDFQELYQYYAKVRLVRLATTESRLLAVFRTGDLIDDEKVFRWDLDARGQATYLDNRGERDHAFPPRHDFDWTRTSRSDHILGRHSHVSVLDEVFVETIHGDLTIKVEDNTEDGFGVYRESVDDKNQSLDDAEISFCKLGALILLRFLPYKEDQVRYFVFNTRTKAVVRADAIGVSCVQLPEDHGIVFPGGYCLQTGDTKLFGEDVAGMQFERRIVAPNGEDVMFVFIRRADGLYVLLPYNLIRKEVSTAIRAHGYSLFEDGALVVFRAAEDEPTRVHPMQVWTTPFVSAEHHAAAPKQGGELGRIGNADLVRGISDCYTLIRLVDEPSPTREIYEGIVQTAERIVDSYYWLGEGEVGDLKSAVITLRITAELIIDEFEKVQALRRQARKALSAAASETDLLVGGFRPDDFRTVDEFMDAMTQLRNQRGRLITLQEVRFIDRSALDALEDSVKTCFDVVSTVCVEFLLGGDALTPLTGQIDGLLEQVEAATKLSEFEPLLEEQDRLAGGLDLLAEVISGLQVDDATARAAILEAIGEVFAHLNRVRAILQRSRKNIGAHEAKADFAAQFKLLGQSVSSAVALSETPEECDDALSRLMLQLEELEARFGEYDEYLPQLASKRDEIYAALESRKQTLLDQRGRRVNNMVTAASRILQGLQRRARTFKAEDTLNAWFAADAMVLKLRSVAEELSGIGEGVKGEEILGRLQAARQDALRSLRDRLDLFEDGDSIIKLGRHRFAVNTQPLELTMLPRDGAMVIHLTGTDYYETIDDERVNSFRDCWPQVVVSETAEVYRGEYLAARMLTAAEAGAEGLSLAALTTEESLLQVIRQYTSERFQEGYERGVHDVDAEKILRAVVTLQQSAGLLQFPGRPRAAALLYWAWGDDADGKARTARRARSLGRLRETLGTPGPLRVLADELARDLAQWLPSVGLELEDAELSLAARYLVEELVADTPRFTIAAPADLLRQAVRRELDDHAARDAFEGDLEALAEQPVERLALAVAWFEAVGDDPTIALEAAVAMLTEKDVPQDISSASTSRELTDMLGQHPRLVGGTLTIQLDEFLGRLTRFIDERVPRFEAWRQARVDILKAERERLRIDEFMPKVMSAFVRNKLINDVYLPIVGDNLAKQLGAAGAGRRTDQMGLLLLVSPPGYGKTTLMEYIANRLGLVFMKINGPALGHDVHSLDPAEAPNATARQEVEKINLALEMGNNVMIYLDDIQHTHPELLQKFISLCDATRRIEGVWKGRTRTYDLRGKKLCVVMAGNPYTESGDKFQIPDMLANRADTYNLGDILSGQDDVFALSYLENALTSNATLQQVAARGLEDVYKLIRMAEGQEVPASELSHDYSAVELGEITAVLRRMRQVQEVVLTVNQQYIESAAQEDAYRTEPPFRLQGSYRNMNKMVEKIVPAMNDAEVQALINDHYVGEAQTLTTGAEANLLKLYELLGTLNAEQAERWEGIRKEFARRKMMGSADDDPVARVTGVLGALEQRLEGIQGAVLEGSTSGALDVLAHRLTAIQDVLREGATGDLGTELHEVVKQLTMVREAILDPVGGDKLLLQLGSMSKKLGGIGKVLMDSTDEERLDARMYAVSQEIAGVRQSLDGATAGLASLNLLEWLAPELTKIESASDVGRLQREVLMQAQEALTAGRAGVLPPLGSRDKILAGTLPVIQDLFVLISESAQETMTDVAWTELMDQLRNHVAVAVTRLARVEAGDEDATR